MIAIFAVLAFYIGLSGVWAFIGTIASAAGIGPESTGAILAIASLLGIVGSLTATLVGSRLPRTISLVLGYGGMTGAVAALLGAPGLVRFALAAFVFKLVRTYVLPYILASVADLDTDGRLMGTTNLVIGGGLAIDAAVAGQLLERSGAPTAMLTASIAFLILSFLLINLSRFSATSSTPDRSLRAMTAQE